jgi:hypothetical protein
VTVLVVDEDDAIVFVKFVVIDSPPPPFPPTLSPPLQVDFERRKEGDMGNDCLMSIDGTLQTGTTTRGNAFASHKYAGKSALRYEIGVSILRGEFVWLQGPYPAGTFNDVKIFNKVLLHFLEPGESVEADNGYVGASNKVKCPDNPCNPVVNEGKQSRVRSRHKTINGRFKTWETMSQVYRHGITHHGEVFWAVAIITQLAIKNGSPLFQVDYED